MIKIENLENGIYAKIITDKGDILINLEYEKTPITVANFVGLSEGAISNTSKKEGEPYYDNLNFHRVISIKNGDQQDFMIQGGCPLGTGTGGPGYQFPDEIDENLKHDQAGILSMANSGPGTNGSQFFITLIETPWLDGKHTVFGKVIQGQDVVDEILQNDVIKKVEIIRVGKDAKEFDAKKTFEEKMKELVKKEEEKLKESENKLQEMIKDFQKTESGLYYKKKNETEGKKGEKGKEVLVHYEGKFLNGDLFDSSYMRGEPLEFTLGVGMVIPGWDEGLQLLNEGEKATLVLPSHLAYGERGAGNVIPPNTTLLFDVELVKVK